MPGTRMEWQRTVVRSDHAALVQACRGELHVLSEAQIANIRAVWYCLTTLWLDEGSTVNDHLSFCTVICYHP